MKIKNNTFKAFRFLFCMDPYQTLNLETETSLLMMNELLFLGHEVFWTESSLLYLQDNKFFGFIKPVFSVEPYSTGSEIEGILDDFDAILIRNDPPFDLNYLHLTYILDYLDPRVVQINPSRSVRNANEKLFALNWPQFVPPTLTTMNPNVLMRFLQRHGKIVVKPIEDCSGRGVELLEYEQSDVENRIKFLLVDEGGKQRFITAQKYLAQVKDGDKRVYLVNGIPVGVVNRLPAKGSFLANIHQGAKCEKTELTKKEEKIIQTISPRLKEMGLFLVGLDLIGEHITEINLTSPSAVRQINQVTGRNIEKEIVSAMLSYIQWHQDTNNSISGSAL
ncbi:glutathione synthase [bacterium]|nr:glutathione synthase [bacterium]